MWFKLTKSKQKIVQKIIIDIYYHGYIKTKRIGDYENIYRVDPLYLIIGKVDGHIEEKNETKYLVFDSADESKEVLQKYIELWDGIENEIKTIIVVKAVNMVETSWKLNLTHMIICH